MAGKEYISYKGDCQSMDYLARFCSKLGEKTGRLLKKAREISSLCKSHSILNQNTPVSIAAAAIYMATTLIDMEEEIPRSEIAKIAKTSQVTIGKCYKELIKHAEIFEPIKRKE